MKYLTLLFTAFCLAFCQPVFSQDKITDLKGEERLVIVTEITPDSVRYKEMADTADQKVHAIHKQQLFMVTFKNGSKEVFLKETSKTEAQPSLSKQEYYQLGQLDARKNFKSKGAFWGTFGASFAPVFGPLAGIGTGAAVSLADPNDKNVITRNPEYKQNVDYMLGYNKQAKKKKLASAAGGFAAAIGVWYIVLAAAFSGAL